MDAEETTPEPALHRLRSKQSDFQRYLNGTRTFEVRTHDRVYRANDTLEMVEFVPCHICGGSKKTEDIRPKACECCYTNSPGGHYSGRAVRVTVTHVVTLPSSRDDNKQLVVLGVTRPPSRFGNAQVRTWAERYGIPCETAEDVIRLSGAMMDSKDRVASMVEVLTGVLPVPPNNRRRPQ